MNLFKDSFNTFAHFTIDDFTNAPAHTVLSVQQFLTKNAMIPMSHPPYLPDLALGNFFLFPHMKNVLKGKNFANVEEVK